MGYLPTPAEIVAFWRSRKTERHEGLSGYLDAVAEEADTLATQWNEYAVALESELGKLGLRHSGVVHRIANLGMISMPNPAYDKVVLHYQRLSSVIGGLVSREIQEEATSALGAIIKARAELKDLLVSACESLRDDRTLPPDTLELVRRALGALHREAAALDVLASTYKAET